MKVITTTTAILAALLFCWIPLSEAGRYCRRVYFKVVYTISHNGRGCKKYEQDRIRHRVNSDLKSAIHSERGLSRALAEQDDYDESSRFLRSGFTSQLHVQTQVCGQPRPSQNVAFAKVKNHFQGIFPRVIAHAVENRFFNDYSICVGGHRPHVKVEIRRYD